MSASDDLSYLNYLISTLELSQGESLVAEELLSGGVVSIVAQGTYVDASGTSFDVAIKHSREQIETGDNFSVLEKEGMLAHAYDSYDVDVAVLELFQNSSEVIVPKILLNVADKKILVMENFNSAGFTLLQNTLVSGDIRLGCAENLGTSLALLQKKLDIEHTIVPVEHRLTQFLERFDELRITLYNGRMSIFNRIMTRFMHKETFTYTDGHPKNMAVNDKGEVMFFDFGRSIKCDSAFVLPNFLAHILLVTLSGCVSLAEGLEFFEKTKSSFEKIAPVDEIIFVEYLTAEIIHRGLALRWLDDAIASTHGSALKNATMHLGDLVFADKSLNVAQFLEVFSKIHTHIESGSYARPF
jgi:hypothetical protein